MGKFCKHINQILHGIQVNPDVRKIFTGSRTNAEVRYVCGSYRSCLLTDDNFFDIREHCVCVLCVGLFSL